MFGALALSVSIALAYASPLPAGQEVRVSFLVDGLMKIPLEFAYSETGEVIANKPLFATTKDAAMKNIRQYIKKAVTSVVRQEARKAGIENLVTNIESQIKPIVYYAPLKCSSLIEGKETIPATPQEPDATPKPLPLFCVVNDDLVTNVAYTGPSRTECDIEEFYEVPVAHQQFPVTLAVTNSIIAGWSRDKWDLVLLQVERQLRSMAYATAFRTVNIMLL